MKLKQLLSRVIIATGILLTGTIAYQTAEQTHVSEAASYKNYYNKDQCTWWAYQRRAQLGKPVSNRWGNAKNWYYNARRSGYATGHTPRRYAVMQSTAGYYGHVAVVERIYNNGNIKISEYNYNRPYGYGTRIISKASARNYNYIY
ncbi:secretory antigen SsaA [Staphylococcus warneri]|uniref:CHAP domain-containing protein n=1 Tax=Staphylococcus warneri TaxID=1292 RepID=UPI000F708F1B|nr:CHAP domain-containing protein [Staphylococcus warneri]VED30890.1 secretory antigen SsaA [Staphylococcus warneri]